jgi:hypothetical protein
MLSEPCTGCPRREAGLPSCIGLYCPAYCAAIGEGHALFIPNVLAWQPPAVEGITYTAEAPAVAHRPTVAASLDTLAEMKRCPERTPEAGCGCGGLARCALGKGREGLVNHADCFACLQAPSLAG